MILPNTVVPNTVALGYIATIYVSLEDILTNPNLGRYSR